MNGLKVFSLVTLSIPLFVIVYYSSLPQPEDKQQKKKSQQQEEEEKEEEEEEEEEEEQVQLEEEEVIIGGVPWSELDPNLLGEIVSRLCLTDQARFLVVCKNWLAAAHPIIKSSSSLLPWHGCMIPGSFEFQIFDPLSSPNHLASLQNISWWSNLGIPSPSSTVFLTNDKHNWLYLNIKISKLFFWTSRYSLLFSPLTKKVITLPRFDYPRRLKFASTFSTQPDSPDCVYCMIEGLCTDKISVIICRNGDKEWTAREFNSVPEFRSHTCLPLYLRGIFYFVSPLGLVASYNILNGEFNFDSLFLNNLFVENVSSKRKMKFFVLNEELMILYFDPLAIKNATQTLPGKQCIRRYDWSRKMWIPVSTLGDKALFVSENIIDVSQINTKDGRNNGVLSNKIYHFFNGGCLIYSIVDGDLVEFNSINTNFLENGGSDLFEYKYDCGIIDTVNSSFWLETPRVRSAPSQTLLIQSRGNMALETRESKAQYLPLDDQREVPNQISHDNIRVQYLPMDNGCENIM